MENYDSIFTPKEKSEGKQYPRFDKEKWAQRKQAERKTAYDLIDSTAEAIGKDGDMLQTFLDVQARFDRYSVGNALLITGQLPEAKKLADFDTWKAAKCFIKKGETGILLLEPGEEFQREDGGIGVNYNVKRAFDISQTTSRQQNVAAVSYDIRLLLKALMRTAPCPIEISENVPDGIGAVYDSVAKKILVRQGMEGHEIFRCVVQELAHAHLGTTPQNRAKNSFTAYCSAYILCKRYHINANMFRFDGSANILGELDAKQVRSELSTIRDTANQISADISRVLQDRSKESGKGER